MATDATMCAAEIVATLGEAWAAGLVPPDTEKLKACLALWADGHWPDNHGVALLVRVRVGAMERLALHLANPISDPSDDLQPVLVTPPVTADGSPVCERDLAAMVRAWCRVHHPTSPLAVVSVSLEGDPDGLVGLLQIRTH
jgi:hypothetical protein